MVISGVVIGSVPVDLDCISDKDYIETKKALLMATYGQHVQTDAQIEFYIDNVPSRLNKGKS